MVTVGLHTFFTWRFIRIIAAPADWVVHAVAVGLAHVAARDDSHLRSTIIDHPHCSSVVIHVQVQLHNAIIGVGALIVLTKVSVLGPVAVRF